MTRARETIDFSYFTCPAIMHRTALKGTKSQAVQADNRLRTLPRTPALASLLAFPQTYTPNHLAERILTSTSAIEGERKQVTILFADLKGSMEPLADRDPEESRRILDAEVLHCRDLTQEPHPPALAATARSSALAPWSAGYGTVDIFGLHWIHRSPLPAPPEIAERGKEAGGEQEEGRRRGRGYNVYPQRRVK